MKIYALDPWRFFKELYQETGLKWSINVVNTIKERTTSKTNITPGMYDLERNSVEMIDSWKNEMDNSIIEQIIEGFNSIGSPFYKDK